MAALGQAVMLAQEEARKIKQDGVKSTGHQNVILMKLMKQLVDENNFAWFLLAIWMQNQSKRKMSELQPMSKRNQ